MPFEFALMKPRRSTLVAPIRQAVTLVEVVFSIGVILIGLLGLLSILPLAGRRAQDSISLNTSSAFADSIMDQLLARRFLSNGRLLTLSSTTPLTTSITSNESFVLDPMFCSGYQAAGGTVPAVSPGNGYSQSLFPYYEPDYNPFIDPSVDSMTSLTWPNNQPRLQRAGVMPPSGTIGFIGLEQSLLLVENFDDLPLDRPNDRSKPSQFQTLQGTSGGLKYGKRVPTGDFSWIATVNPLPGGVYASVSIVVLRKRERAFEAPPILPTGVETPNQNAIGERMAYVTFATGFSGGSGGMVHLVATDRVLSRIVQGDWIMLSRTSGADTVHRWYRVASIGNEAELLVTDGATGTNDSILSCRLPNSATGELVWRHKVLLDGPDWAFQFENLGTTPPPPFQSYGDDTFDDNTYATIIDNVVSVSERTVLLSEL